MDTFRISLISFVMLSAVTASCQSQRNDAACRRTCPSFGINETVPCEELCTTSCKELFETYGVDQKICQQLQAGELAPAGRSGEDGGAD
jgi:hypothetical protein